MMALHVLQLVQTLSKGKGNSDIIKGLITVLLDILSEFELAEAKRSATGVSNTRKPEESRS